jgi:hypothetical protein
MDGRVLKLASGNVSGGPVRLVAFVVDHKTGRVLGAAEQTLAR